MRKTDLEQIRALHLFSEMSDQSFDGLMRAAYFQSFPPEVELVAEGEMPDFLYIVVEGCVELYANWDGKETVLGFLGPVSTLILAATLLDGPFLKSARTIEKCKIMLIPSEDVRDFFKKDANFARGVVKELSHRYRTVVKDAKNIKLRTATEKLANYILRESLEHSGAQIFDIKIEKRKLASFLGMTPENLSRAIKTLQKHGVQVDNCTVTITSEARLEALAKPTELIDDYSI